MSNDAHPSRREALGLGLGALGVSFISTGARANPTDPSPPHRVEALAPTQVGIDYVSYAGVDFKLNKDTAIWPSVDGELGGTVGATTRYTAHVTLPNSAVITEIVTYFQKTAASTLAVKLVRQVPHTFGANTSDIVSLSTSTSPIQAATSQTVFSSPATSSMVDNSAHSYYLVADVPASGTTLWGVRIGFRRAAALGTSFVPLSPGRVYDSRWPTFGASRIATGENRTIDVKHRRRIAPDDGAVDLLDFVPAPALAIAYNITVTSTEDGGYLAVAPGDAATFAASTINWSQTGQSLANGTSGLLDANRRIKVFAGGTTHFIVDLVGYFYQP